MISTYVSVIAAVLQCLRACSGTSIGLQGPTSVVDGGRDGSLLAVIENQERQLKEIMGCPWWVCATRSSGGTPSWKGNASKTQRRSRLVDGFYSPHRNHAGKSEAPRSQPADRTATPVIKTKSPPKHRSASHPKDTAGDGKNATDDSGASRVTVAATDTTATSATTAITPDAAVYETEVRCVSANGGRPCACFMMDFWEYVTQRLDELGAVEDKDTSSAVSVECPSYKAVPAAFIVPRATAATASTTAATVSPTTVAVGVQTSTVNVMGKKTTNKGAVQVTPVRREVDFDQVANYVLEKSNDDYYAVHYGLVGSDIKIRCMLIIGDVDNTEISTYKWDYKKNKRKSNSSVTGTDASNLMILGLDPSDSKNYTCMVMKKPDEISKNVRPYTHYVIAVKKPIYEIQGIVTYKSDTGDCTPNVLQPVQKKFPDAIRSVVCLERSNRYACDVHVNASKCIDDKAMQFNYSIIWKDDADFLTRIRTSKKGRNALVYQRLLAKISNVLTANVNKTLTVQIVSKTSTSDTRFMPDFSRMKMNKYVSCPPGFGIREVFCGACPQHHFSPDKSAECLKCPKGFHQPVSGSEACTKCPNIFASGCSVAQVPLYAYNILGSVCLAVCVIIILACGYCCREENDTTSGIIPKKLRSKFKRKIRISSNSTSLNKTKNLTNSRRVFNKLKMSRKKKKKYQRTKTPSLTSSNQSKNTEYSSSFLEKFENFKRLLKINKKKKYEPNQPKIPFNEVHERIGRQYYSS